MKSKIIAFAGILCITSLFVSGANAEGFSAGASIGSSKIESSDDIFDGSDMGFKVFGKYMFNDNWGIEVGYLDFGSPDDTFMGVTVTADVYALDAFFIGSFPASESFDLFGKVGFAAMEAEFSAAGFSESASETDLALGIGAKFNTSDKFSILGEWEWVDVDDFDAVWMLSLGFEVGFN